VGDPSDTPHKEDSSSSFLELYSLLSYMVSSEASNNFSLNSLTCLLNLIQDLHRFKDMTVSTMKAKIRNENIYFLTFIFVSSKYLHLQIQYIFH
jgi:hypothetical protein